MSNEILRSVNVANEGQEVQANEIASRIEAILLAGTDEEAFKLQAVNTEERHGFIEQVARQVRDTVLNAYTVTEIEREQNPPPAKQTNSWMSHECIKSDDNPRYKWRHTWAGDEGNDFVGYDGTTCLGRVFRLDYTMQSEKWFWLVEHVPARASRTRVPGGMGVERQRRSLSSRKML